METSSCDFCKKTFASKSNWKRHLKEVHHLINDHSTKKNEKKKRHNNSNSAVLQFHHRCLEQNNGVACNRDFQSNKLLINHLTTEHKMGHFNTELISLHNWQEFGQWKAEIERTNKCYYVLREKRKCKNFETFYYCCNRSRKGYTLKNNSERSRLLKSQGSCKLNYICTSNIVVKKQNQNIHVKWQQTHYGHTHDLQHIRIPETDKFSIASKLINGVTTRRILESVRDNITSDIKRIDIVTSKDIQNIKTGYGVECKDGKRNPNDAFSIELWVREVKNPETNPVLFYKPQGENHDILENQDFCLIIMNKFQQQMLKDFPSILTIDSTHGLNSYDFQLTTLMVIDEFGHGFPVAEMFTNKKDTVVQKIFFSVIKDRVGIVPCKTFMSDMDETFFSAWCMIMGLEANHLFCSWHIDRAWQKNLSKIAVKDKRESTYKLLKTLQQSISMEDFNSTLQNAVHHMCLDKDTQTFGDYFKNNYCYNYLKWAYCFRDTSIINTNMHLESMHKVIKYFYLERKTVKRLDKGLNAVLQYVRDKSVERIIRLTKGEHTRQTTMLSHYHREAVKQSTAYVVNGDINYWKIIKDNSETQYEVFKKLDSICCRQICTVCQICIHMFTCSCDYYQKQKTICKHIHIILSKLIYSQESSVDCSTAVEPSKNNTTQTILKHLNAYLENSIEPLNSKNRQLDKIKTILAQLNSCNFEVLDDCMLNQVHHYLLILNNMVKFQNTKVVDYCPTETSVSTKRTIQPQLRFTSTKKKNAKATSSMVKPTSQEALSIAEKLNLFISVSPSYDHTYC